MRKRLEVPSDSLMSRQLRLLGLVPRQAGDEAALAGEAARMAAVRLRPLGIAGAHADKSTTVDAGARGLRPNSSGARRGYRERRSWARGARSSWLATLAACAAAAVLYVHFVPVDTGPAASPAAARAEAAPGLRAKGETKVWIYWERDGQSAPWSPGTALASGDRVRAEVLAADAGAAYWTVLGRDGNVLFSPEETRKSVLDLAAGERAAFAGSVKLVGAAEDERLVVIVCRSGEAVPAFPPAGTALDTAALPRGCGIETFPLR